MSRIESDNIGERELPEDALFGINTMRGVENFDIGSRKIGAEPAFVASLAIIKKAAARANVEIRALGADRGAAIVAACDEIIAGRHHDQFVVDLLEGSGGTSINMNTNEVIANRALQIMGHAAGQYEHLGPNDHVNCGQSTNDVVPSAVKLAVLKKSDALIAALGHLADVLQGKACEFSDVLKIGRTCMQAAQPMTLGQEFSGYAAALFRIRDKVRDAVQDLMILPLGGTAIGTGLGAAPGYKEAVYRHLAAELDLPVRPAENMFDGM